jgi:glutathione S-transferase
MGGATCTQRIIVAALENGAEFNINLVDLRKGEHKQPAHLARQPFGVIPALEDGDFSLYESRAITRYVDATRGGKLTPADIKKRALMEQWISLEQGTITPDIQVIVGQRVFTPMFGGKTDEALVAKHAAKVAPALDIMDAHLAKNQYLAGDSFSLADVFFLPYLAMLFYTPEATLLTSRPNIAAWWKRVSERPSWVKTQTFNEFNAKKE